MYNFAVFGNPIKHSKSPQIHALFSEITGINYTYDMVLTPIDNFEQEIKTFFKTNGLGANITLPFKEQAVNLCSKLTKRALLAKAVNTIKKQCDGSLLGDNTDGIGLISDLEHLKMLHQHSKVLLVGAGGAARGVIPLLLQYGCYVTVTNRTFLRAKTLVHEYNYSLYNEYISAISMDDIKNISFDLIINATNTGIQGQIPRLPELLISSKVYCYDMFYQEHDTPFISWCKKHGAEHCSDGLGMLVHQAAYSFLLWHDLLPPVIPVLKKLRCT